MERLRLKKSPGSEIITDEQALSLLQTAYQRIESGGSSSTLFADAIDRIDWEKRPPRLFEAAIGIALSLDAARTARELAKLGHELHPEDDYLRRADKVLAPPKLIGTQPAKKGLSESMNWIREHAHEYSGSWIAVQEGSLLGYASSRAELVHNWGNALTESTIITRVL